VADGNNALDCGLGGGAEEDVEGVDDLQRAKGRSGQEKMKSRTEELGKGARRGRSRPSRGQH
jgi:hypothetical protein